MTNDVGRSSARGRARAAPAMRRSAATWIRNREVVLVLGKREPESAAFSGPRRSWMKAGPAADRVQPPRPHRQGGLAVLGRACLGHAEESAHTPTRSCLGPALAQLDRDAGR
jgi:hypothetical protein